MPELYTIGYEGCSQPSVLQTLVYNDIHTLLDIRELPLSRKPGFSKTSLGDAMAGVGIRYEHLRALGTPRDIRYQRKIDHDETAFRESFLTYLATQNEAMEALVTRVIQDEPNHYCLLCYEADPKYCHRLFVAEQVRERSGGVVDIIHLHPDAGI